MRLASSIGLLSLLLLHTACSSDNSEAGPAGGAGTSAGTSAGGAAGSSAGSAAGGAPQAQGGSMSAAGSTEANGATVASLPPDQLTALCADQNASFMAAGVAEKYQEETCRYLSVLAVSDDATTDADVQKACRDAYTRCSVSMPQPEDICEQNATCTATVAAYKACVAEYPDYLVQFAAGIPVCAELTRANLQAALDFAPPDPPTCAGVWKLCGPTF